MAHPSSEHEIDGGDVPVGEGAVGDAPLTRKEKRKMKKERKKAEKRMVGRRCLKQRRCLQSILGSDARPEVTDRLPTVHTVRRWARPSTVGLDRDVIALKWVFSE